MTKTNQTNTIKTRIGTKTEPGFWVQSMPIYIGVMLLIVGLLAGFGLRAAFFEAPVITNPDQNNDTNQTNSIEVKVFTDQTCAICNETTSFELLLQKRGVAYTRTSIDISNPQNRATFDSLDANTVPTVSVNAADLKKKDAALEATLSRQFKTKNGQLIMEEIELYAVTKPDYPIPVKFVQNPSPAACVTAQTPLVWEFGDFLCPECYDTLPQVVQLESDFNNQIQYDFKHMIYFGQDTDSERVANSAECARDQNKFTQYKKTIFEQFFGLNFPSWDPARQLVAATQAQIPDQNQFKTCIDSNQHFDKVNRTNGTDITIARQFKVAMVPAFLIDCQYLVLRPANIANTLCGLHPALAACDNQ
ncbi:MAG: thioredoxin domain-containing protein [Candidatus Diapherotrites archaeon]|uniref:Thioredoxin domain-containing protein n=1 Tax=Candidatus Iainarchaeum sp. TaxID=3101447 RepID=A0A8T4L9Y7_9ARCH|nr:thioredoxin domain-containing protein [Candidatus Diapherotrites archaeon]